MEKGSIYLYMSLWENMGGQPGMGLFRFETDCGKLEFLRMVDDSHSFGCTRIDTEKNILYVCNETDLAKETGYSTGRIYGFRINPEDGGLTELFRRETYCPWPDYIGVTTDGKYMMVPHHSWATGVTRIVQDATGKYVPVQHFNDSVIDLFEILPDGTLGQLVDVRKHTFTGILRDYSGKVTIPHPHCAVRSPSGKLFAVCDKGDCHLYIYTVEEGKLKLLSRTLSDVPFSEPRYCAFHPTKPYLFVNHEHSAHGQMTVAAFRYGEDGAVELINKVDTTPPGEHCALGQGFCISPDGKYLYNLLREYNAVAVLEVHQDSGAVEVIQHIDVNGSKPRYCTLSPDGRFLLTTCIGGEIDVYAVGRDGKLTLTDNGAFLRGSAYISFYNPQ